MKDPSRCITASIWRAETKSSSFSFSQPKSGFDCHVGIDNRRPEEKGVCKLSSSSDSDLTCSYTLRLLSSLLTSFIFVTWSSLSVTLLPERNYLPSLLSLAEMESLYIIRGKKVSLQRLFSLVWLQKPKNMTKLVHSLRALCTAWFFQMGRHNRPVYPARSFPCTECFTFLEWNWYHCWIVLLKFQDYTACF